MKVIPCGTLSKKEIFKPSVLHHILIPLSRTKKIIPTSSGCMWGRHTSFDRQTLGLFLNQRFGDLQR